MSSPDVAVRRTFLARYPALLLAAGLVIVGAVVRMDRAAPIATSWHGPHRTAASYSGLDPISPLGAGARPKAPEALGGMVYVSCTHLWAALPDGSRPRLLLTSGGLASPTLSPDARTIAFVGGGGAQIWMAGSDGSGARMIGSLSSSGPASGPLLGAKAEDLQWSPDEGHLSFDLISSGDDPWANGSSAWELDLASGRFTRLGSGIVHPAWVNNHLVGLSELASDTGAPTLIPIGTQQGGTYSQMAQRLSSGAGQGVLAVGAPSHYLSGVGRYTVATVVRTDTGLKVSLRRSEWSSKPYATFAPPSGERIDPASQPSVAGDGSFVAIGLIGADGGPDLGMLDTQTGRWTIKNYAWSPVYSPAPPALTSQGGDAAAGVARAFLYSWVHHRDTALFEHARVRRILLSFSDMGYAVGTPHPTRAGWAVPVTVYGTHGDGAAYRQIVVRTHTNGGRVTVRPTAASGLHHLRTIPDALRFLRRTLTVAVALPASLPAGTRLAPNPVQAWSWNGRTTGSLRLRFPSAGGGGIVTIGYDDGGFGCGFSSVPTSIGGVRGDMVTMSAISEGSTPEVIWPAQPGAASAPFSIGGDVPRRTLLKLAASMQAARAAGG